MAPYTLGKTPPTLPFTFDRVNDGCPLTSSFPIFRLPTELFSHVTRYLHYSDLTSLAMVDRDCRQLARSILYASVEMDRSESALALLAELNREALEDFGDMRTAPTIGVCIKRLIVTTDCSTSSCISSSLDDILGLPEKKRRQRLSDARAADSSYLSALCAVIEKALPNLHVLEWNRITTMSPRMIDSISASPIRHLRLQGVMMDGPFLYYHVTSRQKWALETLAISGLENFSDVRADRNAGFNYLLRQAAPTLRQLTWKGSLSTWSWKLGHSPGHNVPAIPYLFDLVLGSTGEDCRVMLTTFLGQNTRIRSLSVDSTTCGTSEFLRMRGHIPTLQSFHWTGHTDDSRDNVLTFIRVNYQLSCFEISSPLPAAFIDSCVLPILEGFHNLTSLMLVWDTKDIPADSLRLVGSITTLRRLWISAGRQEGWRHDWDIDHTTLLATLKSLYLLENLAFTRDSYNVLGHPLLDSNIEGYYCNTVLPQDVFLADYLNDEELRLHSGSIEIDEALVSMSKMLHLAWERWHRTRMIVVGTKYAEHFPNLRWCYVGQLLMMVSGQQRVSLDVDERDPSLIVLKDRWGARHGCI